MPLALLLDDLHHPPLDRSAVHHDFLRDLLDHLCVGVQTGIRPVRFAAKNPFRPEFAVALRHHASFLPARASHTS